MRFRIEFALLLLALYERCISQSGVSIFDPKGREAELVFVRRRFLLHNSPKRLLKRTQMSWTAICSCVGIPLVRKKACLKFVRTGNRLVDWETVG